VKVLENLLRRRFGLRGLRPEQREVIESAVRQIRGRSPNSTYAQLRS